MSIFSRLRNSRKAADNRKPETKTPTNSQPKAVFYKHIPTHAASDSLACAPPGWREAEDRKSIQAQHKRRNEMTRSTSGLSVLTTIHSGDNYNSNDWAMTKIDQRARGSPMPGMPDHAAMRKLSPLHASELPYVHNYDYISSSVSSNSISSRGSSGKKVFPYPRRPRVGDTKTAQSPQKANRESCWTEFDTINVDFQPHATERMLLEPKPAQRNSNDLQSPWRPADRQITYQSQGHKQF